MARRFNRQNFMQQWATTLYSRDNIDLIQYCQGQALVSVQKLCWNCQRIMHLERDRTFQDGWRWYKRFCTCISFTTRRFIRRTVIIALSFLLFWKWNYFWFVFFIWGKTWYLRYLRYLCTAWKRFHITFYSSEAHKSGVLFIDRITWWWTHAKEVDLFAGFYRIAMTQRPVVYYGNMDIPIFPVLF